MSTSVFSVKKLTKMKLYIYHILQAIFALKQRKWSASATKISRIHIKKSSLKRVLF